MLYDHEAKPSYSVTVKVDDGNGGTDTVAVTVDLVDLDEPPLAVPTPDVTADGSTSLIVTWAAPANAGRPPISSYDVQYRVGTAAAWINGPQNEPGTSATIGSLQARTLYQVQVRATNADGDGPFSTPPGSDTTANTVPTVANPIPNQPATAATAFSYGFPDGTFSDADNDTLTYTATQGDGTALPSWLTFAAATRTFSGTPAATDVGTLTVKVTADDGNGGTVDDTFDISVAAGSGIRAALRRLVLHRRRGGSRRDGHGDAEQRALGNG